MEFEARGNSAAQLAWLSRRPRWRSASRRRFFARRQGRGGTSRRRGAWRRLSNSPRRTVGGRSRVRLARQDGTHHGERHASHRPPRVGAAARHGRADSGMVSAPVRPVSGRASAVGRRLDDRSQGWPPADRQHRSGHRSGRQPAGVAERHGVDRAGRRQPAAGFRSQGAGAEDRRGRERRDQGKGRDSPARGSPRGGLARQPRRPAAQHSAVRQLRTPLGADDDRQGPARHRPGHHADHAVVDPRRSAGQQQAAGGVVGNAAGDQRHPARNVEDDLVRRDRPQESRPAAARGAALLAGRVVSRRPKGAGRRDRRFSRRAGPGQGGAGPAPTVRQEHRQRDRSPTQVRPAPVGLRHARAVSRQGRLRRNAAKGARDAHLLSRYPQAARADVRRAEGTYQRLGEHGPAWRV